MSQELTKQCPVCGRKYGEHDNFCSKHKDLVKLVNIDELVKICPKCRSRYPEDENYCTVHDIEIELAYIDDLVKICRGCGAKYPADYNYCIRCEWDGPLEKIGEPKKRNVKVRDISFTPDFTFKDYPNTFDELDELLCDENITRLKEFPLSQIEFDEIISNITRRFKANLKSIMDEYAVEIEDLHIVDKMILLSKSFVKTEYKEIGGDLGHFEFNRIYIDDRLEPALQITTVIHELAHFILSEILEQIVQLILGCSKSSSLEGFVLHCLSAEVYNELVDEFCAHTVEGRYVPFGYQDYSSYKFVLVRFLKQYSSEDENIARLVGNTFAHYIKSIFSTYIDGKIRAEIMEEFGNFTDSKKYDDVLFETDRYLTWDEFYIALKMMITDGIDGYVTSYDDIRKIYAYSLRFSQTDV